MILSNIPIPIPIPVPVPVPIPVPAFLLSCFHRYPFKVDLQNYIFNMRIIIPWVLPLIVLTMMMVTYISGLLLYKIWLNLPYNYTLQI